MTHVRAGASSANPLPISSPPRDASALITASLSSSFRACPRLALSWRSARISVVLFDSILMGIRAVSEGRIKRGVSIIDSPVTNVSNLVVSVVSQI